MPNKNDTHILSRAVIIDQDHILLCKTLDLEINFYFLPGGHVEHGESAQNALIRALIEETGSKKCKIRRFLGCLEHNFEIGYSSICHNHEYNFIFEAESDDLKLYSNVTQVESHMELIWMPYNKISEIDFRPELLRTLIPQWLDSLHTEAFCSTIK